MASKAVRPLLLILLVGGCSLGASPGGIHARMGYSEERGLRIVEVPAGPGERAGLLLDDRIVAIDGAPTHSMSMREIRERLRGPEGSEVELRVQRGNELIDLRVAREAYRR